MEDTSELLCMPELFCISGEQQGLFSPKMALTFVVKLIRLISLAWARQCMRVLRVMFFSTRSSIVDISTD